MRTVCPSFWHRLHVIVRPVFFSGGAIPSKLSWASASLILARSATGRRRSLPESAQSSPAGWPPSHRSRPSGRSGSHSGARAHGFAVPRKTGAPLPAARRRAAGVVPTAGWLEK